MGKPARWKFCFGLGDPEPKCNITTHKFINNLRIHTPSGPLPFSLFRQTPEAYTRSPRQLCFFFYQLFIRFFTWGPTGMSEPARTTPQPTSSTADPLTSYSRSLYNYTLALWTESRRVAEERARAQGAANTQPVGRAQPQVGKEKQEDVSTQTPPSSSSSSSENPK